MTLDVLLLVTGGILAILGGGLVLFLNPGRYASFHAAIALASLGLLQFGWARALSEVTGGELWFEMSLAFALPVSLSWLLLSRTLFLPPRRQRLDPGQIYIAIQAVGAIAALAYIALSPSRATLVVVGGNPGFPLRPATYAVVAGILLNLTLATARFESTYLSLEPKPRRAFRPGLLGILIAAGYTGYVAVTSLPAGMIALRDIGLGWIAVASLAMTLPFSLTRGRLVDVRVRQKTRPLFQTRSLAMSIGFLVLTTALLWLTRATGWSIARGLWVVVASGAAVGIAALAISNRVNRRLQRMIDPVLYRGQVEQRRVSVRVASAVGMIPTVRELCRAIPANAREHVGVDPVTLLFADDGGSRFVVVSSTLDPPPSVVVLATEPLAAELNRTRRAILLGGRADDLEFIPIYVENATQITACHAVCAAPITLGNDLVGFLLCGSQKEDPGPDRLLLPLLDLICRRYSTRLDTLGTLGEPDPAAS